MSDLDFWPEPDSKRPGSWWAQALCLVLIALGLAAAWARGVHHG